MAHRFKHGKRLKKNQTGRSPYRRHHDFYSSDDQRRACARKRSLSKTQARTVAAQMTAREGKKFDYYPCDYCHRYHVGKRPDGAFGPEGVRFLMLDYFPVDQIIHEV